MIVTANLLVNYQLTCISYSLRLFLLQSQNIVVACLLLVVIILCRVIAWLLLFFGAGMLLMLLISCFLSLITVVVFVRMFCFIVGLRVVIFTILFLRAVITHSRSWLRGILLTCFIVFAMFFVFSFLWSRGLGILIFVRNKTWIFHF